MTKIVYSGPPNQVCHELAEHIDGLAELEPDAVYDVDDEFAKRLVASSAHFAVVKSTKQRAAADKTEGTASDQTAGETPAEED